MGTIRPRVAAVLVAALLGSLAIVAGASPAAAEPMVTVTPSTVVDGQEVTITATGFPDGTYAIVQCSASLVIGQPTDALRFCRWVVALTSGPVPETSLGTVEVSFLTIDGSRTINCLLEGCLIGVGVLAETGLVSATTPIQFGSPLQASPSRGLDDGSSVTLTTGAADGTWEVVQCVSAYLQPEGPASADQFCGQPVPVVVSGGSVSPAITVADPFTTRAGPTAPCGTGQCILVLQSLAGADDGVAAISFGDPFLATDPAFPVLAGTTVTVTVGGLPSDAAHIGVCVEPLSLSTCVEVGNISLDPWGGGQLLQVPIPPTLVVGGTEHDCATGVCALAAWDDTGFHASAPITLLPPPVLTLDPDEGLLEGDTIHVTGTGFPPGAPYVLYRCAPVFLCADHGLVVVAADGTLAADVVASQQIYDSGYCRTGCSIQLFPLSGGPQAVAYFDMATGSLSVTPSSGLVDGQSVGISGADLMPTYAGRLIGPFASGGWVLAQCEATLLNDLTLLGAFVHCGFGPSLQPVTIAGSTLAATNVVEATITRILGGTTDCTAAPGTCVLGLLRFEQDGSISHHLQPLTFAA
jgi:hypothetical protein